MATKTGGGRAISTILVATAISGIAGYLVQGVVIATSSDAQWVRFAAFWSTLYLVIAGLSGIQQEVGRATQPVPRRGSTGALRFTLWTSALLAVVIVASGLVWAPHLFPAEPWTALAAITVGAIGYVAVTVLCGVLYGIEYWRAIAGMMIIDSLMRFAFVVPVSLLSDSVQLMEWAVVLPFPLSVVVGWLFIRNRVRGSFSLDVALPTLSWNASRTVLATVATGILVSGFPLVLEATAQHESLAARSAIIALVTLTRAPIVIPLMALQSFLISRFRGDPRTGRLTTLLLIGVGTATILLALAAAWLGPWLLPLVFGDKYAGVSALLVGSVVATAGATAALCVTGPAVLARGLHSAYVAGWLVAALTLIAILLLPLPLEVRAVSALGIAPIVGLCVHAVTLIRTRNAVVLLPDAAE